MKTIAVALTLAAPIVAANATPPPPATTAVAPDVAGDNAGEDAGKLICKRDKASGSRLATKRICQTAAQWERQRREDQQAVEKVQSARSKST